MPDRDKCLSEFWVEGLFPPGMSLFPGFLYLCFVGDLTLKSDSFHFKLGPTTLAPVDLG